VVTGALTIGAGVAALVPRWALRCVFGVDHIDPLTILVARHWALLLTLIGGLLVYAAYHPEVRVPVMIAATIEKLAVGALIFASPFRKKPLAALVAIADPIMALLYLAIFAGL